MTTCGSATTRLVVLRGNSGSGKSTVAQLLRSRLGNGPVDDSRRRYRNNVALIEQDYIRRTLLGEFDRADGVNIRLINLCAREALDAGFSVIIEGMLFAERYGEMLAALTRDHAGNTGHWYFDLPLSVTLERHSGRQLAADVSQEQLTEWYRPTDLIPGLEQRIITAEHGPEEIVAEVVATMTR